MMKVRLLLVLFIFLLPLCASAQQNDRVEAFGGYSYTGYSIYDLYSGPWERFGYNGWEAAAAVKLVPHLEAEGDFAGGSSSPYGHSSSMHTYMGGPRVSGSFGKVSVYVHLLFGELSLSVKDFSPSTSSFVTAFGGGAEYWFSRYLGVRVIQADYLHNTNSAATQGIATSGGANQFRISTGVVFRFGH
jgi:hypothetical protein